MKMDKWDGVGAGHPGGDPIGAVAVDKVAGENPALVAAISGDDAVRAAINRLIRCEDENRLDEVQLASRLLWSYVSDLEQRWQDLEKTKTAAVDGKTLKEALDAVRDVREATQHLASERSKVDKTRKDIAGAVGAGSLDLDAARDEIGRRLACLRRAG